MNDDKLEIDLSNRSYENSPDKLKQPYPDNNEEYNDPNRWSNTKMMDQDRTQTNYKGSTIQLQDIHVKGVDGAPKSNYGGQEMSMGNAQESFKNQGFSKSCCFGEKCTVVRRIINIICCLLAVPNVALDFAYIAKSTFYNKSFFATLIIILLLRIIIIIASFQCYLAY